MCCDKFSVALFGLLYVTNEFIPCEGGLKFCLHSHFM